MNPEFGGIIGVEVGETRIRVEAFDMRMRVAGMADVNLHPQHHEADVVIEQINLAIEKLQAQFRRGRTAPDRGRTGSARDCGSPRR